MTLVIKTPTAITVSIGTANMFQIVSMAIECPTEDAVTVSLGVQGSLVNDDGSIAGVFPLPSVQLDPVTAAAVYAAIRDVAYTALQPLAPSIPRDATLTPLVPAQPVSPAQPAPVVSNTDAPVSGGS